MRTQLRKAFVCCSVQKIHSLGSLAGRYAHAARLGAVYTPNANPEMYWRNARLVDPKNVLFDELGWQGRPLQLSLQRCCQRKNKDQKPGVVSYRVELDGLHTMDPRVAIISAALLRIGAQKVRGNAVIAVEEDIACPTDKWRIMDDRERREFQRVVLENLEATYRNRLIGAEFNGDELGGHVHAFVVPLDEKGKLNARGYVDARHLISRHTSLAADLAHLGFMRGCRGFKVTAERLGDFYRNVAKATVELEVEARDIVPPAVGEPLAVYQRRVADALNATLVARAAVLSDKAAERDKEAKKVRQLERKIAEMVAEQARQDWLSWQRERERERELRRKQRLLEAEKKRIEMGRSRIAEIELSIIAARVFRSGKQTPQGIECRCGARRFYVRGQEFWAPGDKNRRAGSVEFLCEALSCDVGTSISVLRYFFTPAEVAVCLDGFYARTAPSICDPWLIQRKALERKASILHDRSTRNRLASLGIPGGIVQQACDRRCIHIAEDGHLVFWHRAETGEIEGASILYAPEFGSYGRLGNTAAMPFKWTTRGNEARLVDTPLEVLLVAASLNPEDPTPEIFAIQDLADTESFLAFLMRTHEGLKFQCDEQRYEELKKQCEAICVRIGIPNYARYCVEHEPRPRPTPSAPEQGMSPSRGARGI